MTTLRDLSKGLGNPFKSTEKGTSYNLTQTLKQGTYTFTLNEETGVKQIGLWLGDEYIGFFCDGHITFRLASDINSNDLIIKSLSEDGEVKRVKIEKGEIATEWTPAWEDLPLEDKPVSFIETSGGTSLSKFLLNVVSPSTEGVRYQFGGEIKNLGDSSINVHSNLNSISDVGVNETVDVNGIAIGNGITDLQYDFRTNSVSDNLSFYAYKPSVIEGFNHEYDAQSITTSKLLSPITQVVAYWDDESAFIAGDDDGSSIEVHNPWATQGSTDYVQGVLDNYEYIPVNARGIYADPAIQLGDTIVSGGQEQVVANVDWVFDGGAIANIETPLTIEDNFDDPYSKLVQQQFAKKVTLGDSYQGVSIGREDGIQMLLSPDGTEENAVGRYYADLNKGIAFQTRTSPSEDWYDWMYFDMDEKKFKLSLYDDSGEVDAKIALSASQMSGGNLINNLNGVDGLAGWTFDSTPPVAKVGTDAMIATNTKSIPAINHDGAIMTVQKVDTLSGTSFEFWHEGTAISQRAISFGDTLYYLRLLARGDGNLTYKLRELDSNNQILAETELFSLTPTNDWTQFEGSVTTNSNTQYMQLVIVSTISTYGIDRQFSEYSDAMFTRNLPKDYDWGANDVFAYAQSGLDVLSNEIVLKVDVDGNIVQAGLTASPSEGSAFTVRADNINLEGYTTINNGFIVDLKGDVTMNNATIRGNLAAGTIAGLEFNDSKITFPDGNLVLNSSTNSIEFWDLKLKASTTPTGPDGQFAYVMKLEGSGQTGGIYNLIFGFGEGDNMEPGSFIETHSIVGAGGQPLMLGGINGEVRINRGEFYLGTRRVTRRSDGVLIAT